MMSIISDIRVVHAIRVNETESETPRRLLRVSAISANRFGRSLASASHVQRDDEWVSLPAVGSSNEFAWRENGPSLPNFSFPCPTNRIAT